MKLSVFNQKAPALVAKFANVLDLFLANKTAGINMVELKASINGAIAANKTVSNMLTSISKETLLKLRANSAAGSQYFSAVDNSASLSNILPILLNFVNEEPEVEDIDDIMAPTEDATQNGGPADIAGDSPEFEDATQDGGAEAAVPEGTDANSANSDDIDDIVGDEDEMDDGENGGSRNSFVNSEDFNFMGASASKVAKRNSTSNSNSGIPHDFLT